MTGYAHGSGTSINPLTMNYIEGFINMNFWLNIVEGYGMGKYCTLPRVTGLSIMIPQQYVACSSVRFTCDKASAGSKALVLHGATCALSRHFNDTKWVCAGSQGKQSGRTAASSTRLIGRIRQAQEEIPSSHRVHAVWQGSLPWECFGEHHL